jgi:peptide/nickel transport system ATP-binding protein
MNFRRVALYLIILISMDQALLEVKNLSVEFAAEGERICAVKGISFKVAPGQLMAIVGESGSGKSVTSLALMQLLPKQATIKGEILFAARDRPAVNLRTMDEQSMRATRGRDIAMIFQEPMTSLNPVFTCGYQVMESIQLHQKISAAIAKQKAIELFEKVKLSDPERLINRYPHQLSGGQKQRVMIAMAMSCNPSLLIADEPTTALDVTVQKTILELIKELQLQNGMSVLLITHDLGLVADIADKVLVMYKGEIVEQGNTLEVLKHPKHNYTKALMACRPALHKRGERLPVVGESGQPATGDRPPAITIIREGNDLYKYAEDKKSETVLQVEHLKVHYPGKKKLFEKAPEPFRAVDDVSFTVSKGETVGLVGESGCGKTTLGRAVLQLIPATSGKIILNGVDLAGLHEKKLQPLRKDLQIVFQDPYGSLNPRLTIGNAILEPMKVHSIFERTAEGKDKVMELLEKVNLQADHFNRYPHQFSGGQRQRICIARALALNPSFLIFDESVSALDVSVQAQVLNLLNDLKKEFEFTSIFISHDLSVVRYISDRILVMHGGRIVEEGLSDEVYFNPKEAYTRQLIEAVPGKKLHV